jgi:hypothetical protein
MILGFNTRRSNGCRKRGEFGSKTKENIVDAFETKWPWRDALPYNEKNYHLLLDEY